MALIVTRTMAVNDVGPDEEVFASIAATRVTIAEDRSVVGYPTIGLIATGTGPASTAIQKDLGEAILFNPPQPFVRGQKICDLRTVAGATTVQIIEEQ